MNPAPPVTSVFTAAPRDDVEAREQRSGTGLAEPRGVPVDCARDGVDGSDQRPRDAAGVELAEGESR